MKDKNFLPDIHTIIQAGIDPKTGLPIKLGSIDCKLKSDIKMQLRIVDEQDAVNRFRWYNLPNGLSSQEIERMLYYKGQLIFFYMEETDEFYLMPYALDGTIDFYGRWRRVHPIPFAEGGSSDEEKKQLAQIREVLSLKKLNVQYDIVISELELKDLTDSGVILRDYTNQYGQSIIARQIVNDSILDLEANFFPYMNTALKNATGIEGLRVTSQDEASNVEMANHSIDQAALSGKKFVPTVGGFEFQELTGGEVAKAEEFLMAMQSVDNYRLSLYGLDNGGIFQKKAHMLQDEQMMNEGTANLVMQDGLTIRQHFCDIVNSIWGLGIWCEIGESALGADMDMDGEVDDNDSDTVSYEGGGDNGTV